jgi:hypothetical protein
MGDIKKPRPVKLFFGVITGSPETLARMKDELKKRFGEIDMESDEIPFTFTDYYQKEMGDGLSRWFLCFEKLIDPGDLAAIKRFSNKLEDSWRKKITDVKRPVNLDPGYISASNMVLASTKNYAHRVYLGDGIYAELEYTFKKRGIEFLPWTYPDYRTEHYQRFFLEARKKYLMSLRNMKKEE